MTKKKSGKTYKEKEQSQALPLPDTSSDKRKYIYLSLILLLTILLYSNSIKNQFVSYDDEFYIQNNEHIKSLSSKNISKIFSTYYFSNYHPLTTLSYALDYHFAFDKKSGNINPVRFHIVNLVFHLLNVLLVFGLIFLLVKRVNLAAIAALLFAIHPFHVESVSWISERKDVLYTFFYLLSLVTYLYYQRNEGRYKYLVLCFTCFCFSLLSKSMAVTLPILLLLLDYYKSNKITGKQLIEKIPFLVLSVIFGIVAIKSQQSSVSDITHSFSLFNQVFLISYGIVFYIFKFFVPVNLSVLHPYPGMSSGFLPLQYYLSLIVIIGIAASLIFISFRFKKEILFGLFFFLISISVVLQIFPVGQALVAERYTYVPYIGFIFIVVKAFDYLVEYRKQMYIKIKPFLIGLLTVYIVFFSYMIWNRNIIWKNSESLWADVIKKYPKNFYGYFGLGNAYYSKGNFNEAIAKYNKSISLYQAFADTYYSRGTAKYRINDLKGAVEDFTFAVQLKPNYQEAYSNRGTARLQLQDFFGAKQDFDKAIGINPLDPIEYYNRGNVLYYMQKDSLALLDLNKAIQLKPVYPEAYLNRGLVYYYMKNYPAACNDWKYALSMGSQDATNYLNQFCN
jgi:tetratricopeptide (TPR) repeat protein